MVADVHVLYKNNDLFIFQAGDTDGDGRISTAGQFSRVFCDVMVMGVCPWLMESCLGIDLLPI